MTVTAKSFRYCVDTSDPHSPAPITTTRFFTMSMNTIAGAAHLVAATTIALWCRRTPCGAATVESRHGVVLEEPTAATTRDRRRCDPTGQRTSGRCDRTRAHPARPGRSRRRSGARRGVRGRWPAGMERRLRLGTRSAAVHAARHLRPVLHRVPRESALTPPLCALARGAGRRAGVTVG